MPDIQHIVSGAGAPSAPPPSLGAHYTDIDSGDLHIATGTVSVADWGQPINEPARVIVLSTPAITLALAHRVVHATSPADDGRLQINLPLVVSGRWRYEVYLDYNEFDRDIDLIQPAAQFYTDVAGDPSLANGSSTGNLGNRTARLSQPADTRWRLTLERAGEALPWIVQVMVVTDFQTVA